jgi:hypothetical protein
MGETVSVDDTDVSPAELREALRLTETVTLSEGSVQPDGTVLLDLLRPCTGRGRGRHLYKADMLRENAQKLSGWKMYVDHESDEARRKAGGLPRSIRDLGGRIIESYWNPNVPGDPDKGFGEGAVQGKVRPTRIVRELIEDDPQLLECSINSNATGVKPGVDEGGRRVWIVEGIQDRGSVDFVTEAGAGGRVASLMESVYKDEHAQEDAVLESMSDEDVRAYVERERPGLLEAEYEDDEHEKLCKKFQSQGMPRDAAEKAASKALAKKKGGLKESGNHDGGDTEVEITAEALREALDTDEGRDVLLGLIRSQAQDDLRSLVEAALDEERDLIRREAQAQAERQNELRDHRDLAHERIDAAKLPEKFAEGAKARFALIEGVPTDDLDQIDDVDDDGNVTKSASDKLTEAVDAVVAEQRELVGSLRPAQVRGQGPSVSADGEKDGEGKEAKPYAPPPRTAALLQEAGFSDPDEVFGPA